jgi:hypothetical protein
MALETLNNRYDIRHFDEGGPTGALAFGAIGAEPTGTVSVSGAPDFDAGYYLANNQDVAQNWGGDAYSHYLAHGQNEGRAPSAPAAPSGDGGQTYSDSRVAQALSESMANGFSLAQSIQGGMQNYGISQEQADRVAAQYLSQGQNGGISFNGTTSYAISSNDLIGYLTNSNFNQTQEVWIKNVYYNNTGTQGVIIDELGQPTINSGWHASQFEIVGNTGTISVWNGTLTNRVNIGLFNDQNWHHIAWRYESSGILSGYFDGVKKGSVNITRTNTTPGYYPALGSTDTTNMGNGSYYRGLMGVYRSYNRAINDIEILQNYTFEKQYFYAPSFSAFFMVTQYLSVPASTDNFLLSFEVSDLISSF